MKKLLLVLTLALCAPMTFAQSLPSYVPTNGLVGYWGFNGNANDESGNGNNGTVNGATLTTDRFGNSNGAYSFDGTTNYVSMNLNSINNQFDTNSEITSIVWVKTSDLNGPLISFQGTGGFEYDFHIGTLCDIVQNSGHYGVLIRDVCCGTGNNIFGGTINDNNWHMLAIVREANGSILCYKDGIYEGNSSAGNNGALNFTKPYLAFGSHRGWATAGPECMSCNTNDQQYFNGKLDDIAIYNRALTQEEITNLYHAENTCQSLVINTGVLSFNPPTYNNTVTIYPNPANDHITIDCGNLANVSGWSIKIFNTLGQEVFSGAMNTQQYVVPLNTWSGQGVYFVKIYDASNQLMNTKKIILQ